MLRATEFAAAARHTGPTHTYVDADSDPSAAVTRTIADPQQHATKYEHNEDGGEVTDARSANEPERRFADRGYDFDKYRRLLRNRGINPLIARRGTAHGSGLGRTGGGLSPGATISNVCEPATNTALICIKGLCDSRAASSACAAWPSAATGPHPPKERTRQ